MVTYIICDSIPEIFHEYGLDRLIPIVIDGHLCVMDEILESVVFKEIHEKLVALPRLTKEIM